MARIVGYWIILLCIVAIPPQSGAQSPLAKNLEITRQTVVFIYARDAHGVEQPDGTGFLLPIPLKSDHNRGYLVLVTARHMADPGWQSCVPPTELIAHFNKKEFDPAKDESGIAELSLAGQQWTYPDDDSVDIAFTFLDGKSFDSLSAENRGFPISQLPSASEAKAVEIGSSPSGSLLRSLKFVLSWLA